MTRYLVDTPAKLALVRIALDQANGLRDAAGNPTPRLARIFRAGVEVTGTLHDPGTYGVFVGTRTTVGEMIVGDDGTAALELPVCPEVDALLGKTVNRVAIARVADLVAESALPPRVQQAIADKRGQLAAQAAIDQALGGRAK